MHRRTFLSLGAASAAACVTGCATNPVTGRRELMIVSEDEELRIDRAYSPHQISADYGAARDAGLQNYVQSVGRRLAANTHRTGLPYAFRPVNAAYVNAYAFPGGTVCVTRGILLQLGSEAELAGLIGHELGHINARHTAKQQTQSTLTGLVLGGVGAALEGGKYADVAAGLGQLGAGMLLARYSRENEREADALGLEYMTRAGHGARGFVDLMDMLVRQQKERPSALEVMFSTHPMSDERYRTAAAAVAGQYAAKAGLPLNRERYMEETAPLRAMKGAVESMQRGEEAMMAKRYADAERFLLAAQRAAPDDYAALLMLAKCRLAMQRFPESGRLADEAARAYPGEPQAYHVRGMAAMGRREFAAAYQDFAQYERLLPGNPNTLFYKGLSLEGMGRREEAAAAYAAYLKANPQGEHAQYAYQRLAEWGYVKK